MDHTLELPLLLDGDIGGPFALKIRPGECMQGWMLRHPARVAQLQGEFLDAQVDILCAPTGGLNSLSMAAAERYDQSEKLLAGCVALTQGTAADLAEVAGIITTVGQHPEPFGPLPFTDLIDTYAEQALMLYASGVKYLVIQGMTELTDARAAVLGARQAPLPIFVTFEVDQNGRTATDRDVLAAMLCLQNLGIAAFGISCDEAFGIPRTIKRLALYAQVPLMARVHAGDHQPEDIERPCFEILAAGARILQGGNGITPMHAKAMRSLIDRFDFAAFPIERAEDSPLLLADENRVYYLEEDFSVSEEIECEMDMSEAILDAEDEGIDAIQFHLKTLDDAYNLGQNAHMASAAISLLADSEESLEMALLYYNGRALIDARSDVDPVTMQELAKGYGAIIR